RYGISCVEPGSEVAPGPGRSPAESTVAFPDAGMQKTLTRFKGCTAPSVRQPGATPVEVIVRAGPCLNAPGSRCRHLVLAPVVHWLSNVQGCGGLSKPPANPVPQNPQNVNIDRKSVV